MLTIFLVAGCKRESVPAELPAEPPDVSAKALPPLQGTANLCISVTLEPPAKPAEPEKCFNVPFDGNEHDVTSGPQLGYQTKINHEVTVAYLEAGVRIKARLWALPDRHDVLVAELMYQDNRVVQQLGIPYQITEGAIIDTTQLAGTWILRNDTPRMIYRLAEKNRDSITTTRFDARLTWSDAEPQVPRAVSRERGESEAAILVATRAANRWRRHHLACDWIDTGRPREPGLPPCRADLGKQLPFVSTAGGTKIVQYFGMTSGIGMEWSRTGGTALVYSDSGLEPPTDLSKPDLAHSYATRGDFRIPPRVADAANMILSATGKPNEVTATLTFFRQNTILAADRP
jgi:hypothetical protein